MRGGSRNRSPLPYSAAGVREQRTVAGLAARAATGLVRPDAGGTGWGHPALRDPVDLAQRFRQLDCQKVQFTGSPTTFTQHVRRLFEQLGRCHQPRTLTARNGA